jgi:pantetheine-phosphate adenylyltransferase
VRGRHGLRTHRRVSGDVRSRHQRSHGSGAPLLEARRQARDSTNIGKGPLFSLEERIDIIKDDIAEFSQADKDRIKIVPFDGLLIHFARDVGASMIIRGLRAVSDFEYEIQMANMNARMEPNIETIFLMASDRHQFIASSLVKDIARLGGDTSQFVSKKVFERLKAKFKRS